MIRFHTASEQVFFRYRAFLLMVIFCFLSYFVPSFLSKSKFQAIRLILMVKIKFLSHSPKMAKIVHSKKLFDTHGELFRQFGSSRSQKC